MTTRSSLGIIWTTREAGVTRQLEVPGMIFYGYWPQMPIPELSEPSFRKIWLPGRVENRLSDWATLHQVASIEVQVLEWPPSSVWLPTLEEALRWFLDNGAVVAWCGDEWASPSVRTLDPGQDSGGVVYAAYSRQTGLLCKAGLDDEYAWLDVQTVAKVWAEVSKYEIPA